MTTAAIGMMILIARVNWRHVLLVSLLFLIAGNFISIQIADFYAFCAIRFLTGLGSGAIVALSYAVFGLTAKADRNFGLVIMLLLIYAAVVFPLMPLAFKSIGMNGVLLFFGAFALLALPFVGNGLSFSQFFGTAGAFTAAVVGARFDRGLPLILDISLFALSLCFILPPVLREKRLARK